MKVLGFDLETTSVEPTARVVQVAAIEVAGDILGDFDTVPVVYDYCDTEGVQICAKAAAVNGITPEMLVGKETDRVQLNRVVDYVMAHRDNIILAGHNVRAFDIPLLWKISQREKISIPTIDTLICSSRVLPDAKSHKQTELVKDLNLGSTEGAHEAGADIRMVFSLVKFFCQGLNKSPAELADWCKGARILRKAHFGKFQGLLWGFGPRETHVPKWYAEYMVREWDSVTADIAATLQKCYSLTVPPSKVIKD